MAIESLAVIVGIAVLLLGVSIYANKHRTDSSPKKPGNIAHS